MRTKLATGVAAVLIGVTAFAPAAMASGGSTSSGGGSGGSGSATGSGSGGGGTSSGGGGTSTGGGGAKTEPCVKVNSFSASGSQSAVTANAALNALATLSVCGGGSKGFTVSLTATDPSGTVAGSSVGTWIPSGSTPYSQSMQTDSAAFATAYQVTLRVVNTETGVTDATSTATATTPATRTPACVTVASLSGREGNIGTLNALWAFYTLSNCGPTAGVDVVITGTGAAGNVVTATDSLTSTGGTTSSGAHDFDPAPVDTYTLTLTVVEHVSGDVLSTASVAV